jgi:NitT/TauT family transport system ATP-binding protein
MPIISLKSIQVEYATADGPVQAVQHVDLDIEQGEFLVLVGPSGCGKSTLLQVIAGLVQPTSGEVSYGGNSSVNSGGDSRGNNGGAMAQHQIGVVFQRPVLLPWRTVMENVMLPVEALGLSQDTYQPLALAQLEMLGLAAFANRYPYELSGGMQQRASIARALVHQPSLVLMDEPFSALDAITREQLNTELRRIWKETGKTVLFVTHSIPEAVYLATRVVVMSARPGRISDVIDIELPAERTIGMTTGADFGKYVDRIRAGLEGH